MKVRPFLFLSGKLTDHLQEIDWSAIWMFDHWADHLNSRNGVTKQLKAINQMKWVKRMNNNFVQKEFSGQEQAFTAPDR